MFSGIVEKVAEVTALEKVGTNVIFTLKEDFDEPLYIDQSISHNGVCLTVIEIDEQNKTYKVEAIKETLDRSNLGNIKVSDSVNLERCIKLDTRLDGHMVSGHVDTTATLLSVKDENGSWLFNFSYPSQYSNLIIDKGSITINGISLTVVEVSDSEVSVALIPYTYEHTNLKNLNKGDKVNLEFDIMGKYIVKYLKGLKLKG